MKLPVVAQLLKKSFTNWDDANAPMLGAALSYYTTLALAPLLIICLAVAGFFLGPKAANGQLASELASTVGQDVAEAIQGLLQSANRPRTGTLAVIRDVTAQRKLHEQIVSWERLASVGRVSPMPSAARQRPAAPYRARLTNRPRQSRTRSSCDPISGASTGAAPETSPIRASIRTSG